MENPNVSDVELEIIDEQYKGDIEFYNKVNDASNQGIPLFTKNDLYIPFILDKLFRYFCIVNKVTKSRMKTALNNYLTYLKLDSPSKKNTSWTNLLKLIKGDKNKNGLTFASMQHLMSNYFGYSIVEVKVELYSPAKKETLILSTSDIEKYLKEKGLPNDRNIR